MTLYDSNFEQFVSGCEGFDGEVRTKSYKCTNASGHKVPQKPSESVRRELERTIALLLTHRLLLAARNESQFQPFSRLPSPEATWPLYRRSLDERLVPL